MYTLITIFYISLLSIVAMIFLKRREVRTGRASIISRLGAGSDHVFQSIFASVRTFFSYWNRRTFVALLHWLSYHLLFHTRKIYVEAKDKFIKNPHGKKLMDAVRGRGEVKNHGASFYLRRISSRR